jgi:hypothetical protein
MAANQNREMQLRLNENDRGKAVPVLSQASCHENTWQSEGTAPDVHNLGIRRLVSYQLHTLAV